MDEVFQKLTDPARAPLDLKRRKTIFGRSHRPHGRTTRGQKPPEVMKIVQAPDHDVSIFKVKWRNLTLKIRDKGERVPRIEVVVHNAEDWPR